ncbi:MAG TPA: FeoA family protein [bacterium]|nr:FeoA family protein [bacterium]
MLRLSNVPVGKYRITGISMDCPGARKRLTTLGIFTGDEIEVTKASPGPVIFKKGGTSVGIGHGIAMHISVVRLET